MATLGAEKGSLTPIGDVIANLLSDNTLPFNSDDARIWNVWDEVVGPDVSENTHPSWIKDGRLRVAVSDPIWLQELKFLEEDIREELNKKLRRKAVKKIEFRVGPK